MPCFIHHVFFWLKRPGNTQDRLQLIAGLEQLRSIAGITSFHIGVPAPASRDVIDSSYDISLCIFFSTAREEQAYQSDPVHLRFIEECRHLWERVLVYDAEDC